MIWSHVTGWDMSIPAFSTKDLRYQSTWVLDQNGKTTSLSSHVAASIAPLKVPWSSSCAFASCGSSARKPASANSAVNGGSSDIRSIAGSLAARRRDSWMRCWLESCGSTWVVIMYSSVEHFSATASWPPASGLMYQTSSGLPLSPLQAARRLVASASVTADAAMRRDRGRPRDRVDERGAMRPSYV